MLSTEIRYILTAVMFYTRIPVPSWTDYSPEFLNKSRKYLPLIGWLVGGVSGAVFWGASQLWPLTVAVVLAMIASIWLTGAFHEDGWADVCDGFGGGYTPEKIITIMKDSRLGAYGVIGLILLLGLKFTTLHAISLSSPLLVVISLINGHTLSRLMASLIMQRYEYVQLNAQSKSNAVTANRLSVGEFGTSMVLTMIPLVLYQSLWIVPPVLVVYLGTRYMGYFFQKWLGGYTGDCLGATQQVSEQLFYLAILTVIL